MCPHHILLSLLYPSRAEMEGSVDSCVTARSGQCGERLPPGQLVAARAQLQLRGRSLWRGLSVEAVAAEAEVWMRAVLIWLRQAKA